MTEIIQLSQHRWLSLAHILTVDDHTDHLSVLMASDVHIEDRGIEPLEIYLEGTERLTLLNFLKLNAIYTRRWPGKGGK